MAGVCQVWCMIGILSLKRGLMYVRRGSWFCIWHPVGCWRGRSECRWKCGLRGVSDVEVFYGSCLVSIRYWERRGGTLSMSSVNVIGERRLFVMADGGLLGKSVDETGLLPSCFRMFFR